MANYADVSDVQIVMGMENIDSWTTSRINFYLAVTTDMINNMLGDLHLSDRTEQIESDEIDCDGGIVLDAINVTAIKKIDGTTYTGTYGIDRFIKYGRKLYISNLATYVTSKWYDYFTIQYTAGYVTIPNDIKMLQALMIAGELSKESGKIVKSYTMGPRSVTFTDQNAYETAKQIISFYNPFTL